MVATPINRILTGLATADMLVMLEIHTVRYLHVHRSPKEADISLRVGGVRPLPYAFHTIAPYHQHRHHAHPRRLEVHRY